MVPGDSPKVPLVRGEITQIDNRVVVLSCPWFLTGSPAVRWVSEMYEWRELGGVAWDSVPVFARRAITAFARGVSRRQGVEMDKRTAEAEKKRGR